tara:strand:- start:2122 stop:3039 length:918 start_codon:yes stop_codon:yes gene_type:complete
MKILCITPVKHLNGITELLSSKGQTFFYEGHNKAEIKQILLHNKIDVLVCNPNQQLYLIDREILEGTSVKTINSCSTGLNHIDLEYCRLEGIEIQCHKDDYELINELPSTSELAFGLMMSLLRKIPSCHKHVSKYEWDYTQFMGRQVKGLKIGIVGYGRLGQMMHRFCEAFEAEVYICDPYRPEGTNSLEEIFSKCDVVSLHVHVTSETRHMINKDLLNVADKELYIINTSRGEVVKEQDIIDGLREGALTGYATDVIEDEFGSLERSPLIRAMNDGQNIIITPHVGGMTIEGQTKAYKWSIGKL